MNSKLLGPESKWLAWDHPETEILDAAACVFAGLEQAAAQQCAGGGFDQMSEDETYEDTGIFEHHFLRHHHD
jgi:hypothetical protein